MQLTLCEGQHNYATHREARLLIAALQKPPELGKVDLARPVHVKVPEQRFDVFLTQAETLHSSSFCCHDQSNSWKVIIIQKSFSRVRGGTKTA